MNEQEKQIEKDPKKIRKIYESQVDTEDAKDKLDKGIAMRKELFPTEQTSMAEKFDRRKKDQ